MPRRLPALLIALLATGCGASPPQLAHPADGPVSATTLSGSGVFTDDDTSAIAYDRKLAPKGAQASLTAESSGGQTITSLVVEGFLPRRTYGAHLHTNPCGKSGADAGPHYRHRKDGPASPDNEIWLDFETNASGEGRATARHPWGFDPASPPRSLIVHAKPTTKTGAHAGDAGDRIACLTIS
ncbi:MAG TPA: superoxide dismutase family protein [Nonomuraea sp.]|uniref:superoxide dismutase family protein n=1 Tax=Nonomuraea sp. NPDC049649 TaxID=3155776 RepID=UPI002CA0B6BA|nr:superoxide dismutase family protein [Nonomuraea sp.]